MMKVADKKARSTSNPRGPYNNACDVCARKKIKCDGVKPVCQPCQSQSQQKECKWTKNSVRKPRTEAAYVEAMHKQAENLRKYVTEFDYYTKYIESLLDDCYQYQPQNRIDFRASRPSDYDELLGQPDGALDRDFDFTMMGGEDNDRSPDGNDSDEWDPETLTVISIPPLSLQVEPFTQPSRFPAVSEDPDKTYVLFVDGVQPSHYNPDFDWSRNLPPDIPLDRPSHDRALDLLFRFFTCWGLRIIPPLFLRDMYRALSVPRDLTPPKTPHYSPMLHNALVALALALLDDPELTDLKTRLRFASTAKSFIEDECRRPNLSVVQALSILASFHSSQGDQTLGYMYSGMSAHMSQTLGLNIDCSEWVKLGVMDEAERLDRHWASWSNFTQDVCWSFYVGRNFCVAAPTDADAHSLIHIDPEFDQMPWFYLPAGIAPQPNNLTITFEATCRLLMIGRRIMGVINGVNKARSRPLDFLITDIDVQLNMWKSSLPADLEMTPRSRPTATPHKLTLHLSYWWLTILLHRPFFHHKSRLPIHTAKREIDHVKLCRSAAENIMELLSTWRSLYTLRYCPITLIQTVFAAGTVYLLTAKQASSGMRTAKKELRHSLGQETLVLQYLGEIGTSWKCATSISGTLRSLMEEQVRPLLDRKTIQVATLDHSDGEEENGTSSSSKSSRIIRKSSSITKMKYRRVAHPRTIPSGSGQSSLSTSPKHILVPPASSAHLSPSPTQSSNSTYAGSSAPIAIRSQRSSSSGPSSPPDSWGLQPSPGSSSRFPINSSFVNRGFQGHPRPFSNLNYNDDPFSNNGNGSIEDVGHIFGGQCSFLAQNVQLSSNFSSQDQYAGGYLGMLGGQTLPEAPVVGPFSDGDTHSLHLLQASFGTGFLNRESPSSFGEWFVSSSHGDNDGMEVDNMP